jgi:hypothetical protein
MGKTKILTVSVLKVQDEKYSGYCTPGLWYQFKRNKATINSTKSKTTIYSGIDSGHPLVVLCRIATPL